MHGFTSRMMAVVVAALGVVPILLMLTPAGPHTVVGRVISILVTACCAVMALLWLFRWPTRRQSQLFSIIATGCIAAACLVLSSPDAGLLGCTAFAALAGYVGFFHTSHYLALVLSTVAVTSIVCAIRLALETSAILALAKLLVIAIGAFAVPFSVQVLVHLLGGDAIKSDTDPLTGLRNRRGFYRRSRQLIGAVADSRPRTFTVAMADLDRFKQINDTHGHAEGDRILVAVADKLRQATHGHAVVARVGGEEFLVAETNNGDGGGDLAERIRSATASTSWRVTASVGAASAAIHDARNVTPRTMLEHLVDAADTAMYEAKRAGGNQTRHVNVDELSPKHAFVRRSQS